MKTELVTIDVDTDVDNPQTKSNFKRRRKSDRGTAKHLTVGIFIAFLAAVIGPIMALQLWTLQIAYDAKLAASQSRPYPYTSLDAEQDKKAHDEYHKQMTEITRREVQAAIRHMEDSLLLKVKEFQHTQISKLNQIVKQLELHSQNILENSPHKEN